MKIELVPADDSHGGMPEGLIAIGQRYEIDLGGAHLRLPARLELMYDPGLVPASIRQDTITAAFFDKDQGTWISTAGEVDQVANRVTTELFSASWWSVFTPVDPGAVLRADRRLVYLPSNQNDPLQLCPYVANTKDNPCTTAKDDADLDPINLVFYGLSASDILQLLEQNGWGRRDPFCQLRQSHVAYAGIGEPKVVPAVGQVFWGLCDAQYHLRLFEVPGSKWVLGAAHFETLALPLVHRPSLPWEHAEEVVAESLAKGFRVEPDRLLVQRDCPDMNEGCLFRGQQMNGWATLIVSKNAPLTQPTLTLDPQSGPVATRVRVHGSGFWPHSEVIVIGDAGRYNAFLNRVNTDETGEFEYSGVVPATATIAATGETLIVEAGSYTVRAQLAQADTVFAETRFRVLQGPAAPWLPVGPIFNGAWRVNLVLDRFPIYVGCHVAVWSSGSYFAGTWNCDFNTSGALSGTYDLQSREVRMTWTQSEGPSLGSGPTSRMVGTFVGSLAVDGKTASGTVFLNWGHRGTWSATAEGWPEAAPRPSPATSPPVASSSALKPTDVPTEQVVSPPFVLPPPPPPYPTVESPPLSESPPLFTPVVSPPPVLLPAGTWRVMLDLGPASPPLRVDCQVTISVSGTSLSGSWTCPSFNLGGTLSGTRDQVISQVTVKWTQTYGQIFAPSGRPQVPLGGDPVGNHRRRFLECAWHSGDQLGLFRHMVGGQDRLVKVTSAKRSCGLWPRCGRNHAARGFVSARAPRAYTATEADSVASSEG